MEDCEGQAIMRTNIRIHFVHRHMRYTIVILEEGNLPYSCCPSCNMFVPWSELNRRHPTTALCVIGS